MFGWLRKRERNEHVKLAKQNALAAKYLADFQSQVLAMDPSADPGILQTLQLVVLSAEENLSELATKRVMPPERFNEQWAAQKNLRRLYDEILSGRRAFAKQFGNASERLEPFDTRFVPNEGWKIFLAHFPQPK